MGLLSRASRKPGSAALLVLEDWPIRVAARFGRRAAWGVRWLGAGDTELERVCFPVMRQGEFGNRKLHFDLSNLAGWELRFRQTISEGLNFALEENDV